MRGAYEMLLLLLLLLLCVSTAMCAVKYEGRQYQRVQARTTEYLLTAHCTVLWQLCIVALNIEHILGVNCL